MSSILQDEWIARVLGIVRPAASSAQAIDVLAIWTDAKDQIDSRLNALARELRSHGHPDLDQIADKGLFGLTTGRATVPLLTGLRDYATAPPERRVSAAVALVAAAEAYRSFLDSSPIVDILDNNPFGVDVMLFATADRALKRIASAVSN